MLTGHGNEEHALHRVGVRAERRNVRYVMCYRRRSLDVFAPLLVALRASVAMSASVCLSVCLSHARSHISETVHSPQTLLVFNSVLPVAGARSCPGSRSCTSGFLWMTSCLHVTTTRRKRRGRFSARIFRAWPPPLSSP